MTPDRVSSARSARLHVLVRFGYDGARFSGVQPQPGKATVGAVLRARLEAAAGTRARSLNWASRTDAGVHARGNLATAAFPPDTDVARLAARVEAPRDDGLLGVRLRPVPRTVHARNVGVGKRYRYWIEDARPPEEVLDYACRLGRMTGPPVPGVPPPDAQARRAWQLALPLDVARMRAAAAHLVGTHDFRTFAAGPLGDKPPVRTITAIDIWREPGPPRPRVVVVVRGEGFLKRMIRIIVGTLAEAGAGVHTPDDVRIMREACDRTVAGMTAPARGLLLDRIDTAVDWFGDLR